MSLLDRALRMGEEQQRRKLKGVAEAANALEDEISELTDDELKSQTAKFKDLRQYAKYPSVPLGSATLMCSLWAVRHSIGGILPK